MRWCVSMAHVCIDVLISVCAVSASAHARSIHVCALANADTLSLSLPLCLSPPRNCTTAHSLFVSLTLFRAHARALFSCVRAHAHLQTLSSLLTDPKTKDLWSNPDSPESRALLLKTFGSKFTPEECQKKVLSATPRMIRDSFYAWDGD